MSEVVINSKAYVFQEGQTILDLLRSIGIEIPTLCFDDRLHASSVCRLCLVNEKDHKHWIPACRTLLVSGMEIATHTPEIEQYRKDMLRLLAKAYPLAEVLKQPQKEFHRWLQQYAITSELENSAAAVIDTSHPYIQVDMSRCINCYRCVKICDDLQGQFVWHIINRGDETKIISDSKGPFAQSSCVACGACADTCPTGAIEDRQAITSGMPDHTTKTVCAYCGVGCEMEVGVKDHNIVSIHPANNAPVNKGHLCVKGRYAWEYNNAKDRITQPMIRRQGQWEVVSWKEAVDYCAQNLMNIVNEYGPDSIGMIGSARATNEDNYLVQKFARAVIGTNNVDNCARVCHQPTAKAMSMTLGTGASTNAYDDIEKAKTILVAGAHVTGSHPVVGARIKQAVRKGANLIVIDPRRTELARLATCHLPLKPGTNIPLFQAMAHVIIREHLYDEAFIRDRTEGWDLFNQSVSEWTPERAAAICGIHPRLIKEAARLFARQSPSMCFHGLGLTEHTQGTENVMALINIVLLTGNIGKAGTGINPLRGQNNVQGAAAMGCDPAVYAGMASVNKARQRFEALWKTALPDARGLHLPGMLEAARAGRLKALWITGYDVFFTMPGSANTAKAFDLLNFVIVQDMFMNETARNFADVFLPCASSFEKEGTFMNAERRIQKVRKVIPGPANVKPDWEIVCRMAAAMGRKELFPFSAAEEIWNEIRETWNDVYGITYERLDKEGLQWPCPDTSHPGTTMLHTASFPRPGGRAKLSVLDFIPTPEQVTAEYPFILVTGRELYHFNAGTMTYRTANKDICHSDLLHVNPVDAQAMELKEGDRSRLCSRYGEAILPICIDDALQKGTVFCTFNDNRVFVNMITSPHADHHVQTPEYKVTAVRIEKI